MQPSSQRAVVILIVVGLYVNTTVRLDKPYAVPAEAVAILTGAASIAR